MKFIRKIPPKVLNTAGILAFTGAIFCAVKSSPKAFKLIDEFKEEKPKETKEKLIFVRNLAKEYLPSILLFLAGVGFLSISHNNTMKTLIATTLLNSVQKQTIDATEEFMEKTLSPKKLNEAKEEISVLKMKKHENRIKDIEETLPYPTGLGESLIFDALSGRYFLSDINSVREAENNIIKRLPHEMFISLNEFYDELEIPRIKLGDYCGWEINDLPLEITYASHLSYLGSPALVLNYNVGVLKAYQYETWGLS